jgi:hypothetical protein
MNRAGKRASRKVRKGMNLIDYENEDDSAVHGPTAR